MPLKKLPPEMSYAALREAHPPKESERESAAKKAKEIKTDDSEERTDPILKTVPVETSGAPDAAPGAVAEVGPAKDDTAPTAVAESKPAEIPAPEPQKATGKVARPRGRQATKTAEADQVRLRGYLQIPAEGAFESFDEMRALYGERKAFGLALTAGVKEYRKVLSEGKPLPMPSDYTSLTTVEVVRTLPASMIDAARTTLDPRGVLGTYQLAGLLFKAALGAYLAKG